MVCAQTWVETKTFFHTDFTYFKIMNYLQITIGLFLFYVKVILLDFSNSFLC